MSLKRHSRLSTTAHLPYFHALHMYPVHPRTLPHLTLTLTVLSFPSCDISSSPTLLLSTIPFLSYTSTCPSATQILWLSVLSLHILP